MGYRGTQARLPTWNGPRPKGSLHSGFRVRVIRLFVVQIGGKEYSFFFFFFFFFFIMLLEILMFRICSCVLDLGHPCIQPSVCVLDFGDPSILHSICSLDSGDPFVLH